MTYESDPIRWTQSLDQAPETLRGPLDAGTREGPSELQMKTLALKLAALSAGTAVAASAATAHASTTAAGAGAAGAGAAGSATLVKVALSLALAGATAAGVAVWRGETRVQPPQVASGKTTSVESAPPSAPEAAQQAEANPSGEQRELEPSAPGEPTVTPTLEPAPENAAEPASELSRGSSPQRDPRGGTRSRRSKPIVVQREAAEGAAQRQREAGSAGAAVPTEIELLRRARAALAARPREAYQLTEEHRAHYPRGVFAQEREALAIEALVRAGDLDMARDLARQFVRAHPSSPHAHRLRETLGVQ